MDRTIITRADIGTLSKDAKEKLFDLMTKGEAELGRKSGKTCVWVTTKEGEDVLLEQHKLGKMEIKTRFPKRFLADGSELSKENIGKADLSKLVTKEQAHALKQEAEKSKAKEELRTKLDKMSKKDIEKEYGVSQSWTKEKMILTVLDKTFGE